VKIHSLAQDWAREESMTVFGLEIQTWIFIVLAGGQLIYAALTYHGDRARIMENPGKPPRRPIVIIGILMLLTWAAVIVDMYTRPRLTIAEAQIINYGMDGPVTYHAIVQLRNWVEYKTDKAVLITRTVFADKDRMTDEWIAKSVAYTIDNTQLTLVTVNKEQMRYAINIGNLIEFNFAVIPAHISPDQIRTLNDVVQLGGKLLATSVQGGVAIGANPVQDLAPAAPK
jgi:hypothetical protein